MTVFDGFGTVSVKSPVTAPPTAIAAPPTMPRPRPEFQDYSERVSTAQYSIAHNHNIT